MNEAIRKICSRLIVFASAVLLMSCTHESTEIFDQKSNSIRLSYSFNHITSTKALATGSENAISEIGLMFYDTGTDAYVANVVVEVNSSGEPTGQADFVTPKPLLENTTYKVLAFAKGSAQFSGDQTMENYLTSCASKDYEKMKLDASIGNLQRISTPLSFCGETTFINRGEQVSPISVVLTRSVAKVTLRNGARNLHIKWAKTAMYRSEGYLYHQQLYPGRIIHGDEGVTGVSPSAQYIGERLYAYPNMVGVTKQNDDKTTCLLVAAYYNADGDWAGTPPVGSKLTYYRVNIARGSGSSQLLKRNNVYNVNINSATGAGSETEDEALGAPDNKLNTSINDWEEDNDGAVITDPNGNYLRISDTNVIMQPAANETKTVTIDVKSSTYWRATVKSGADLFSAVPDPANSNKLIITTLKDGHPTETQRGVIEIKVYSITTEQELTSLTTSINLMQFPKSMEILTLAVDGKIVPFEITAPKTGGNYFYEVITGSSSKKWVAVGEGDVSSWVEFTKTGGNGSLLNIKVNRNGVTDRFGTVTVSFDGNGDGVADTGEGVPPPVVITIIQEAIDEHIVLLPHYSQTDKMIVDVLGRTGISKEIWVNTSDSRLYPKYVVTLDVPTGVASLSGGAVAATTGTYIMGSSFTIDLISLYPGDDLVGTCTIKLLNPSGGTVPGIIHTFPLILTAKASPAAPIDDTSVEGHVYIQVDATTRFYVYDRNFGAIPCSTVPTAKYYGKLEPSTNLEFKGTYTSFKLVDCPEGWRMMDVSEFDIIKNSIILAGLQKVSGVTGDARRYFLISSEKDENGLPIYCFLSSSASYWLTGYYLEGYNMVMHAYPSATPATNPLVSTDLCYTRCVKTVKTLP